MPQFKSWPTEEAAYTHDPRHKYPKLELGGFRYTCVTRSEATGVGYWRCYKSRCAGRIRSSFSAFTLKNAHSPGCNPISSSVPDSEDLNQSEIKSEQLDLKEVDSPPAPNLQREAPLVDTSLPDLTPEENAVSSTSNGSTDKAVDHQKSGASAAAQDNSSPRMPKLARIPDQGPPTKVTAAPTVVKVADATIEKSKINEEMSPVNGNVKSSIESPKTVASETNGEPSAKPVSVASPGGVGFERGLQAVEILGAANAKNGELMFLMKWQGSRQIDLVTAREANAKCPHVVIKFYEKRVGLSGE